MIPDFDIEIIELMDKYNISYDEALERFERKQGLRDLALQRKKAHQIKMMINRQKQKRFQQASQSIGQDIPPTSHRAH